MRGEEVPIHRVAQRVIHPGMAPLEGEGFVAAQPVRQVDLPGSWPHSLALLHWFERGEKADALGVEEQDSALGALLTLVTDRRCQVVPEVMAQVEGAARGIAIPIYGQIDPTLGSPMPSWDVINQELRTTLARIASLSDNDAEVISAAMHMHYCAALLAAGDLTGAYALVVGGLEVLAQRYGSPPADWAEWDQAASWDAFMTGQQLSEVQATALRDRLIADRQIRLAETFATYVADRLPAAFWDEPVSLYRWGVNGITGEPLEGSWETGAPHAGAFAGDRRELKRALKHSYQARSRFMHAGQRGVAFSAQLLSQIPGHGDERLSFSALRGALRRLILIELENRSGNDPFPPLEVRLQKDGTTGESAT